MKYRINSVELNIRDQGHGEPVLVFYIIGEVPPRTWDEVIERLHNKFRCIAYDHRGWGGLRCTTWRLSHGRPSA
jgi:hypothetical protein